MESTPTPPALPVSFRSLLWSADFKKLDVRKHQRYIIHQLLNYGDLDAFAWLMKTYSLPVLQDVFIHSPKKIYTDRSFSFVSKFLLHVDERQLRKEQYVSTL